MSVSQTFRLVGFLFTQNFSGCQDWLEKCKPMFDPLQLVIVEAICDKVRKGLYENFETQVGSLEDYLKNDPWDGHISIEGRENG